MTNTPDRPVVLVVDDDPDVRSVLRAAMEVGGWTVIEAPDGRSALSAAWEADLVVLDVMMPVLDGIEVLRLLRADGPTALTPVIVLSALRGGLTEHIAFQAGADLVLEKPCDPLELLGASDRLRAGVVGVRRAFADLAPALD